MPLSESTVKRITKMAIILLVIALMIYSSYIFADILLMMTISFLLALILSPLVQIFEKNGINRLIAVLMAFAIAAVILFLGFSVVIPKIGKQMNLIAANLTQKNIDQFLSQFKEIINQYIPIISSEELTKQLSNFSSSLFFNSINSLSDILSSIFSVLAISVIVPFMTFFLLKDQKKIIKGVIDMVPNKYFEVSYWVIKKITIQLGRYVRGWIFDATLVGIMAAIGLSILGIKNAISIGAVAAIGHLIPYFGPVIGGLPAILISVIQFGDLSMLPSIVLTFIIIYSFDNGYIQPNIFSKSTDIHPLLIIILILAGSQILGIIGMLLAVPTATVVKTAAREIYFGYKNYKIIHT